MLPEWGPESTQAHIEGFVFCVCPNCKYAQGFREADWYTCRRCETRLPYWRWVEIPYIVINKTTKEHGNGS